MPRVHQKLYSWKCLVTDTVDDPLIRVNLVVQRSGDPGWASDLVLILNKSSDKAISGNPADLSLSWQSPLRDVLPEQSSFSNWQLIPLTQ